MIYLITTIYNKESRWGYIRKHLEENSVSFTPILAPDYKLFSGLTDQQAKHQSLTLAYLQIAQGAIFQDLESYIVIEDDISLNENFAGNLHDSAIRLPLDCDLFYATKTEHNRQAAITEPVNDYICRVKENWWETPITVWGKRMMAEFNERMMAKIAIGEHLGNIDHELMKICEEGKLNFYGAEKNIANGLSTARHLADETITFETSIS